MGTNTNAGKVVRSVRKRKDLLIYFSPSFGLSGFPTFQLVNYSTRQLSNLTN